MYHTETPHHRNYAYLILFFISVIPVLAVYTPFALKWNTVWGIPLGESSMQVIFTNWDGPNYVYNAITNYVPDAINRTPFLNVAAYYPAHFPGISWALMPFAAIMGYYYGSFALQLLTGFIANIIFFHFIKPHTRHALWLTLMFTLLPPRILAVRSVFGPELLMIGCIIGGLMAWEHKRYVFAGLFTFFAVTLKFQALVLPAAMIAHIVWMALIQKKPLPVRSLIAPLFGISGYALIAWFYGLQTGNPHAYFTAQQIAGLQTALPFSMFNFSQKWVGTGHMEAAALYFIGLFATTIALYQQKRQSVFWIFTFAYTVMLSLIPQVDIMRLALPVAPLTLFAFRDTFSSKLFRLTLIASLPVIYLYTINFIIRNQAPITIWSLFR